MPYFDIDPLLETMLDTAPAVSDLNLSVGKPPQVEVDGQLRGVPYASVDRLMPYHTELVAMRLLRGKKDLADKLVSTGSADLSYSLPRRTRFRVNIFSQRGTYSIVLRVIPNKIPTVEELGIPKQLEEITRERNGIVLVTGPTGSGKSTTLAALINKMNHEKAIHIVTIEDPIEYLYLNEVATINQREIGTDTENFAFALRAALRQAPKVILVGEMRDVETISTALEASETGHLVLSTLHTIDAAKTIDRIVGVFPKDEERQIRTRFAQSFKWIVSQKLIPKKGGGRRAICEILRANSRTREYIQQGEREGKSLTDAMTDGALDGMQTFDGELERFVEEGALDAEEALTYATNPTNLRLRLASHAHASEAGEAEASQDAAAVGSGSDMGDMIER
ncbi:MAG TPA: PilT/PilU family type 4a pilus ATPase [Vicinamibacteria bacterium]|jgi:twitching motility protein PilT